MIYNWVKICQKNGWDFKVFTTLAIYEQVVKDIEITKEQIYIIEKVNLTEIIKATLQLNHFEKVVVTSLQNYYFYYLPIILIRSKLILTIHNVNTWFIGRNLSSIKSIIKHIIRKLWLRRSNAYIVNSQNMSVYISDNNLTTEPVGVVPFSLRSLVAVERALYIKTIVYPGLVSKKRKSYDYFIQLCKDFPNITFILLGKLVIEEGGDEIESEIINNKLNNVIYYHHFVENDEFRKQIKNASLIFSFVNTNYINQGVPEVYGRTKDSGISYLMAEYGIPLIVNKGFKNFDCLDKGTLYYTDYNELKAFINYYSGKKSLEGLSESVIIGRQALELDNISDTIFKFIEEI
jgi:hypothetical protein